MIKRWAIFSSSVMVRSCRSAQVTDEALVPAGAAESAAPESTATESAPAASADAASAVLVSAVLVSTGTTSAVAVAAVESVAAVEAVGLVAESLPLQPSRSRSARSGPRPTRRRERVEPGMRRTERIEKKETA
jgi:hypothetical protein